MDLGPLFTYFSAEKMGSWLLVASGLLSLMFAAFLYLERSPLLGMAWPLLAVGLLALTVGVGILQRTPAQVAALQAGFSTSPAATGAAEQQRIAGVIQRFRQYKVVEVLVVVAGFALVFMSPAPSLWAGVGLGCVLMGSYVFVFDSFAHHHAEVYAAWLKQFPAAP